LYRRESAWFWAVALPFVFVLAASAAHKYPITARLLQFLFPLVALLIGLGIRAGMEFAGRWGRSTLAGVTLAVLLLAPQAAHVAKTEVSGNRSNDIRPLLQHLSAGYQPQDCLVVHALSARQFRHYSPRFGLDRPDLCVLSGADLKQGGAAKLAERGNPKRIWLLYSDATAAVWDAERAALATLRFRETDRVTTKDTALFLFESESR
jgi:hypothetical protein